MTSGIEERGIAPAIGLRKRRSPVKAALRYARRTPVAVVGLVIVVFMVLVAVFAPLISPYDPFAIHYDALLAAPGHQYLLGTDNAGRDLLSRIIWGSRTSLYVGILSVLLGQIGGGFLGLVSGYFGGRTDIVIQRVMDVLLSFPTLVLALAIVAALGPSVNDVIFAIGITQSPRASRIIRSATLAVREAQYVDAARAIGCSDWRIVFRHVLPQTLSPLIVLTSLELPHAILIEASLSFLGLGTPPPAPSWGGILSGAGREFVQSAPWLAIYPGVAISLTVFGFNILGDGLRDLLDPRLRTQ